MTNRESFISMDIVLPIGPDDTDIAGLAVRYLFKNIFFDKLYIVSGQKVYSKIRSLPETNRIVWIDEEVLIPGVSLETIRNYCASLFSDPARAGWYFQQFLKMEICNHPGIGDYYLIWDADTIPLKKLSFFDESGKMLLSYKTDSHQPYFDTLDKLGLPGKQTNKSFITEHMLIKKSVMKELLAAIEYSNVEGRGWIEKIMLAINKDQYVSGFSEFETYGNYLMKRYPDIFRFRKIKHKRSGSKITETPGLVILWLLSLIRDTVSFEKGH